MPEPTTDPPVRRKTTGAPNYRQVNTCTTCKYAVVDYGWYVACEKFKDAGSDCGVCDEYQLADRYKQPGAEGGELIPDRAFVGGEINIGDELIVKGVVMPKPFIGIFKGDKVTLNLMGYEKEYTVTSIDENGMTVQEVD